MASLLTSNTDRVAVENANDIPKIMQYEKNKNNLSNRFVIDCIEIV